MASRAEHFRAATPPTFPAAGAPTGGQVACRVCALNPICHPRSREPGAPPPVESRRRLEAGDTLFESGTPRTALYAVRAGFLKASAPDAAGGAHIARFLLPGDAIGLDAFTGGVHRSTAVALRDCEVCEIPAYRVEMLAEFNPRIGAQLRTLLGRELGEAQEHAAAIARLTASQRMALFLLDLSRRWEARGYSAHAFRLPMSRREIGDHLGLTMETASRLLCDFQARGWIALPRGGVEILAAGKLAECVKLRELPPLPGEG